MNKKTLFLIAVVLIVIIGLLDYSIINNHKNRTVNLKNLIEDIDSIRENGEIINAKEKETSYSYPTSYYGNGYYITVSVGADSTDYFIYSNDEEIWHYTKIFKQEER